MTKVSFIFRSAIAFLAATSFSIGATSKAAAQNMFGKIEIDQNTIIVIATALRNKYALTVIEQLTEEPRCWTEISSNYPIVVQLDLLDFDFTRICGRSTDSGGYSIRMADRDIGLDYKLEVIERDGDMLLVGTPYAPDLPELIIGHAHGISEDAVKIILHPGWRLTRRTYEGEVLGHYYFTHDLSPEDLVAPTGAEIDNVDENDEHDEEVSQ